MNTFQSPSADRFAYLAENLVALHASPDLPWLTGRFEFLGERALGAALTALALPDERGVYRPSRSGSPRPARTRDLWEQLGLDRMSTDVAIRAALATAEKCADAVTFPAAELFDDRGGDIRADSVILAPATHNQELIGIGMFNVSYTAETEQLARILCAHTATAIYQMRIRDEGRRLHSVDPRLWIPDENFLLAQLRREVSRSRRYGREMGLAVLTVENEGDLRFRFGDFFTDRLLRSIGGQLLSTVRDSDVLGALGGSYAVIHTETGIDGTQLSADRLRDIVIEMVARKFPEAPRLDVTVRCVAFPTHGSTVEELLAELDPEQARRAA